MLSTGAALIALAACEASGLDPYGIEADAREAAAFAAECVTYAPAPQCREQCLALADYESAQIQCLVITGRAGADAAPDPAPELAGGPSLEDMKRETAFHDCMAEDRPHAECEAAREGGQ